jgi:hypothetical protein
MPERNFATRPLRVALDTGFHSLVEVLLRAGVDQEEKDYALFQAMHGRRLDFIQLLAEHGAAISSIPADEVMSCWILPSLAGS